MTIQITSLKNGFRVVTDYIPHVETTSLGVWVKCGSRYESFDENGTAHYLEHMAFKGTHTRSAQDISQAIEQVGGYLNAYTSHEATAYYAHTLKTDTPLALDIIQDILNNPVFNAEEMEKERNVILQEISQTNDTPDDIVFDYFQEVAFPDQPLGRSILGPADNIKSFTSQNIANFMETHYSPERMVLSMAGKCNHDAICKKAEEYFQDRPQCPRFQVENAAYKGGLKYVDRPLEQAHIVLGFEGVNTYDPGYWTLAIWSAILGDGMSSRLFQEVREKLGLVYSVYTFQTSYLDKGVFGVYAGCDPQKVSTILPVIAKELKKIAHTLTPDEIIKAKNQLKARLMMSLESTSGRCQRLANQILKFDRPLSNQELIGDINRVTQEDLISIGHKILSTPPTLSVVGNKIDMPTYSEVQDMLKSEL